VYVTNKIRFLVNLYKPLSPTYKGKRRDPDADTGGRWFESVIFINNSKGVGKRTVMDRQKVKTGSESRRYSVASRLKVRAGRMVRQADTESRKQGRSKPGGLAKRIEKAGAREKHTDWHGTYKMNWHRQIENTGDNGKDG
jgi:hypothetical protein